MEGKEEVRDKEREEIMKRKAIMEKGLSRIEQTIN